MTYEEAQQRKRVEGGAGLILHWCDKEGWNTADCACSKDWQWFASWRDAEESDRSRREVANGR